MRNECFKSAETQLSLILVFSREKLIILKLFILETLWNLNKQGFNTAALDTNTSAH